MTFTDTRKAVVAIENASLRADLEKQIERVEKESTVSKPLAEKLTTLLIHHVMMLQKTLPETIRAALIAGLFADGQTLGLDHQFERKVDYICGPQSDCGTPAPGFTCVRDTSLPGACSSFASDSFKPYEA